jgi:hypothetical protein
MAAMRRSESSSRERLEQLRIDRRLRAGDAQQANGQQ